MLTESDRATLPVIATVFDKLNQEYKKYLDAEQSYTMVSGMSCDEGLHPTCQGCFLCDDNAGFWGNDTTEVRCVPEGKVAVVGQQ